MNGGVDHQKLHTLAAAELDAAERRQAITAINGLTRR
jgi:hypothetical protein